MSVERAPSLSPETGPGARGPASRAAAALKVAGAPGVLPQRVDETLTSIPWSIPSPFLQSERSHHQLLIPKPSLSLRPEPQPLLESSWVGSAWDGDNFI